MGGEMSTERPRVGISACLLGQTVRYDGGHKGDQFLTHVLGRYVEWVPVCPELEVGMGVPREPVRLVGSANDPRMIAERSHADWTEKMQAYAKRRVEALARMRLDGFVLKKDSPSCGMERVRVYGMRGVPTRTGRGVFARALTNRIPLLPTEEEGRLSDLRLRENFIERIFAYHRWQRLLEERPLRVGWSSFTRATNFCFWPIANLIFAVSDDWLLGRGRVLCRRSCNNT